jgi:3D (Asp-Asp-Asp) domain-containing protein
MAFSFLLSAVSFGAEVRWLRVTAYCPCAVCCGPNACGLTASGRPAIGQLVAVDPRVIPLGAMLHIPGHGWQLAADTGRLIKGNRVDLLCASHDEARQFGVRWMPVTILTRAEWQRRLDDAIFDARFEEIVAAGRRLAAGTWRRADGGLELAR